MRLNTGTQNIDLKTSNNFHTLMLMKFISLVIKLDEIYFEFFLIKIGFGCNKEAYLYYINNAKWTDFTANCSVEWKLCSNLFN